VTNVATPATNVAIPRVGSLASPRPPTPLPARARPAVARATTLRWLTHDTARAAIEVGRQIGADSVTQR
jgi:hypothetical protein